MLRTLIEEFLLFVLPFCLFAGYLVIRRRNPFDVEHWSRHLFWLSVSGLVLGIGFFIYTGIVAPRHTGPFVPPHVENGRLVPGEFDDRPKR
jgi:ABC-type Fe3+ transport system permease subunit